MRKDQRYPRNDPRVVALGKAILKAGGPTVIGRYFNIRPQAVSKWEICPKDRAMELAELSKVSIHDLRPDVFGYKARRIAS